MPKSQEVWCVGKLDQSHKWMEKKLGYMDLYVGYAMCMIE